MRGGYLLGQSPQEPCQVCHVSPVPLRPIEGWPEIAECGRCGLFYQIRDPDSGADLKEAIPLGTPGMISVCRRYYNETGCRPGLVVDLPAGERLPADIMVRHEAFHRWLRDHPVVYATAMGPEVWPYASLTVIVNSMNGEPVWQVVAPPGGMPTQIAVPFSPEGFPIGTVVTICVPAIEVVPAPGDPEQPS